MNPEVFNHLLARVDHLLDRLETLVPAAPTEPDWQASAFLWRGQLVAVPATQRVHPGDLLGVERQKNELLRNTRAFLSGRPANNALLWGARGTGKSSLVKAMLSEFADQGLRLIEVDRADLIDLPQIVAPLRGRPERFILFADDLSFEADDASYKALKAAIEGSVAAPPDNVLIYATSNRRHLLPEYHRENLDSQALGGEIHHGEAVEEKISLSDRFGLWLAFHPFNQEQYLDVVKAQLTKMGIPMDEQARAAALRWALSRGARSGRVAVQFCADWASRE